MEDGRATVGRTEERGWERAAGAGVQMAEAAPEGLPEQVVEAPEHLERAERERHSWVSSAPRAEGNTAVWVRAAGDGVYRASAESGEESQGRRRQGGPLVTAEAFRPSGSRGVAS